MSLRRRRLCGVVGLALSAALAASAVGQPARVLPGQDLQHAIDTAPAGATLVLAPGQHRGPVVVAQPLTLRGEAGAQLVGSGQGSVLTLQADHAGVEHLEIIGSGRDLSKEDAGVLILGDHARVVDVRLHQNLHGVYVRGGKHAQLVDNHVIGLAATEKEPAVAGAETLLRADGIHHSPPGTQTLMGNGLHLWNANGAQLIGNHIQHVRDGIYVAHTDHALFRGNRIHDSRYAIHYMYSDDNTIEANELWRNVAGAALMFSRNLTVANNVLRDHSGFRAYGLLLQDVDMSTFRRNAIRGNLAGMRLQHSNSNTFASNVVLGNLAGIVLDSASQDNAFTRNRIGPNLRQIELTGPPPPTDWSVEAVGNRWHGSLPMDLTGKGVSVWPHHEVDLMAERRETFPPVQLLIGSAGIRAVEWALSRAPVPGMRYITDPHPLTREHRHD